MMGSRPSRPHARTPGQWPSVLVATLRHQDWAMYGVGAAAAIASFDRLRRLALECGWSPHIAWLLAICIDLYAIAATRRWLRPGTDTAVRRQAAISGWVCVGLSVAGNTVQHALSIGYLRMANGGPSWVIVVLVAAVPPVMLAWLVHVEALFRFSRPATDTTVTSEVTMRTGSRPATSRRGGAGPKPPAAQTKRVALVALLEADPPTAGVSSYAIGKSLASKVGLDVQAASRYVREWRQAHQTGTRPGVVEMPGRGRPASAARAGEAS